VCEQREAMHSGGAGGSCRIVITGATTAGMVTCPDCKLAARSQRAQLVVSACSELVKMALDGTACSIVGVVADDNCP
jgi:hypothetical protein